MAGNGSMSVEGADRLLAVSKALKAAGETGLRKELNKGMATAAKPLIPKVKEAARGIAGRGGIGAHYAKKAYRAQVRTGAKTAGVRIVGAKTDPRVDQQGRIAHPVFGRKNSTVVQNVPAAKGFFSETISREAPAIQGDLVRALDDFVEGIIRRG